MEPGSDPAPSRARRRRPLARRAVVAALSVLALQLVGAGPPASEPSGPSALETGSLMVDLLVLRPLGMAATAVGFGFFLIAGPLAAPAAQFGEAWDVFVMSPYEFTFQRRLGELEDL